MPQPNRPGRDVAAEITDLIIRKLEEGVPPWSRPWSMSHAGGRPLRHCGTPYTGINTLYLWAIADAEGFRSRYWMTYRQAEALRSEEHKSELQSLMRISYAVFCLKKKNNKITYIKYLLNLHTTPFNSQFI